MRPGQIIFTLLEGLKHARKIAGLNTNAIIGDHDQEVLGTRPGADPDHLILAGEFKRVRQQVQQHLANGPLVNVSRA